MQTACSHLEEIFVTRPARYVCEECEALGERWVHLRMCLTCGYLGCCDASRHKHATQHFHDTGHPLMRSIEPGESWAWCYIDKTFLDDLIES